MSRLRQLNQTIREDPQLGAGFRVGHSYFCDPPKDIKGGDAWNAWYENVIRYEIQRLLEEYWFDDAKRAEEAVSQLLASD